MQDSPTGSQGSEPFLAYDTCLFPLSPHSRMSMQDARKNCHPGGKELLIGGTHCTDTVPNIPGRDEKKRYNQSFCDLSTNWNRQL